VVARDIAHAKIAERLDAGEPMPAYLRDHASTTRARPRRRRVRVRVVRADDGGPDGLLRGAVPGGGRVAGHAGQGEPVGGGDRGLQASTAGSTSARSAARRRRLAQDCITRVEVLEYPELGMEAVWRIEVRDFPAFIVVDDKGNDFFADVAGPAAPLLTIGSGPG
jgi:fumarate hydratase class I